MNDDNVCSFCGKNRRSVKKLIAGQSAFICNECVYLCVEVLAEEEQEIRSFLQDGGEAQTGTTTITISTRVTGTAEA
ncbi:MAG: hypothetical protein LC750_15500, partial [Actinobacteria bacterium]|nr:hypothetical protein [Actinomycetota bacterium]